jgi:putative transposase
MNILTERHFLPKPSTEMLNLCKLSATLYNKCNYIIRQTWFSNQNLKGKQFLPDVTTLTNLTRPLNCFQGFNNSKTAKQTIRKCLIDWSNFKKARNAFFKDPSKFKAIPEPPGYKKKLAQVIFYNETIKGGQSKKDTKLEFIEPNNSLFKIKSNKKYKQVVITPKHFGVVIEITYEHKPALVIKQKGEQKHVKLDKKKLCCIDLGVNTLAAVSLDQHQFFLVNGRIVKSINQLYNKKQRTKTASYKRYWRLENYFHHTSKFIIDKCLESGCGTIVIGRNKGWKQNTKKHKRMNRKNRQTFQNIPFYLLEQKIEYKAKMAGIEVVYVEEADTSQASFYDNDPLPSHEEAKVLKEQNLMPIFSGIRKYRGLYISKDGIVSNADINGSLNIGRKYNKTNATSESEVLIACRSLTARPVRINPLKTFSRPR